MSRGVKGVEEIQKNVSGDEVKEIKWLKRTSNGERCDSLSAMIKFQGECLWSKVFIGYMLNI